jgi:hypothetical protein
MRAKVKKVTNPEGVELEIPTKGDDEPLTVHVEEGEYIVKFPKGKGIKLSGYPKLRKIWVSEEHLAKNYKPASGQKMGEDGEYIRRTPPSLIPAEGWGG